MASGGRMDYDSHRPGIICNKSESATIISLENALKRY